MDLSVLKLGRVLVLQLLALDLSIHLLLLLVGQIKGRVVGFDGSDFCERKSVDVDGLNRHDRRRSLEGRSALVRLDELCG